MTNPTPSTTQTRHPWRATLRTVAAAALAALPLLPVVVEYAGIGAVPWVAGAVGFAGAVTRVLAIPAVNSWLTEYFNLGASPRQP